MDIEPQSTLKRKIEDEATGEPNTKRQKLDNDIPKEPAVDPKENIKKKLDELLETIEVKPEDLTYDFSDILKLFLLF